MSTTTLIDIGLIYVGKQISVEVYFDTSQDLTNAYVSVDVPPGVSYASATLPRGTYNSVSDTWNIGTVYESEDPLIGILYFTVTNDAYSRFPFTFTGGALGACESCLSNNTKCVTYIGIGCDEFSGCPDLVRNIYDVDGVQVDETRTWDGDGNGLDAIGWDTFNVTGDTSSVYLGLDDSNGVAELNGSSEVSLDSAAGVYKLVTQPNAGTSSDVLVYNTSTNEVELNSDLAASLGINFVQLTAGGATIDIQYFGLTAPSSFIELPTGTFTLTVPSGVVLDNATFIGDSDNTDGSDQWSINIIDTDGRYVRFIPALIDLSTFAQKDLELNGHNPIQDPSTPGIISSTWQNVTYDDFMILLKFINSVTP